MAEGRCGSCYLLFATKDLEGGSSLLGALSVCSANVVISHAKQKRSQTMEYQRTDAVAVMMLLLPYAAIEHEYKATWGQRL